jgi:hypothetical protein
VFPGDQTHNALLKALQWLSTVASPETTTMFTIRNLGNRGIGVPSAWESIQINPSRGRGGAGGAGGG